MIEATARRGRRTGEDRMAAALAYAELGWPVCPGAHAGVPAARNLRPSLASRGGTREVGRACSCDRIGCPAPGAHPVSPAWRIEASTDAAVVARWWRKRPLASVILVTGRVFDVLDVPGSAGSLALSRMAEAGFDPGPVALGADGRALFFVATRGAPGHADEWWSSPLDCTPGSVESTAGLRWHCRDSYVVAPPRHGRLASAGWVHEPAGQPLPDAVRLLAFLADACDDVAP